MSSNKVELLGPGDRVNYEQVIEDLKNEGQLDKDATIIEIIQMERPGDQKYIGAWIHLVGDIIPHSSGPDAAWRKYVYVSPDWEEEFLFDGLGPLYHFLATREPKVFRRNVYINAGDGKYQQWGVSTFDLSAWMPHHDTQQ